MSPFALSTATAPPTTTGRRDKEKKKKNNDMDIGNVQTGQFDTFREEDEDDQCADGWNVFLKASNVSKAISPNRAIMEFGNEQKSSSSKYGMRIEIDEESEEARKSKGLPCGIKPSQEMIDDHEWTHLPFRSWCKRCAMGRAQEHPHRQIEKEELGIPVISWDYYYMKRPNDGKEKKEHDDYDDEIPMVAWTDSNSKAVGSFAVPNKGECEYAIRRGQQDVNKILGYNKMIFRGDQEPALRVLMERIKTLCGDQCILEESPVGDSQSNGAVESIIKSMQ